MAATIATGLLATRLLLLFLCTAAATGTTTLPGFSTIVSGAAPPAAAATVAGGDGLPKLPFPFPGGGLPRLPFPFLFPGGNPAAGADCLKAVHQAESCVGDVLRSLASAPGEDAGSKACCGALQAVGARCLRGVLPVSPFRALYAPLVKHACGGGSPGLGLIVPGTRA